MAQDPPDPNMEDVFYSFTEFTECVSRPPHLTAIKCNWFDH